VSAMAAEGTSALCHLTPGTSSKPELVQKRASKTFGFVATIEWDHTYPRALFRTVTRNSPPRFARYVFQQTIIPSM
jgi:hypothetical protein